METIERFLTIGSGDGYGSGDGSGYGYGSGDGSGYGSGYGDGYGSGIKSFNWKAVHIVDGIQTILNSVHGNIANGYILKDDLTLEKTYVARVGNSFAHGETAHIAMSDAMAKDLEKRPLSERISLLRNELPDADEEVPFETLYNWHHVLTGSCKQGRDSFCEQHEIDRNKKYTLRYFFRLTRNAYGSEAIREASKAYGIENDSDEEE